MEERLDDAIHVLRTHAEGSLPPGLASSLLSAGAAAAAAAAAGGAGVQGVSYSTSVGSSVPSVVQPMEQMVSQSFNPFSHPKVAKVKIQKNFEISFCTILRDKWCHVRVLLKRFHSNGHTIRFLPQSQKLELPVHTKCVEPCESTAEEISFEW